MLHYDKPVFIYPQLLPTRTYHHKFTNHTMGPSEKMYYILYFFSGEECTSIFTLFVSLMCKVVISYYLKRLLIIYNKSVLIPKLKCKASLRSLMKTDSSMYY